MGLHGFGGDDKPLGDLVILEAVCDQLQDVEFPTCERLHRRAALSSSGNMRLSGPLPLPRYPGEATLTADVLERSVTQRPNHRNRDVAVAIAATLALTSSACAPLLIRSAAGCGSASGTGAPAGTRTERE
jgi:hypothetical protein